MLKKEQLINELVVNSAFKQEDAEEIVDIILKNEGENVSDITNLWLSMGARWDEEEVVEYVNEDSETQYSLNDILSWDCFYRLKSGLIISWRY